MNKLSVIIPAYNEEKTIYLLLEKVNSAVLPRGMSKEVIVVNDASTDGTAAAIKKYTAQNPGAFVFCYNHSTNLGKGASLRTGIAQSTGNIIVIQDADLEYDPNEYPLLLKPITNGVADVVYGSRFVGGRPHRILFFWHTVGNKLLTFLSNMLTNLNLTDMETCYKCFRAEVIKPLLLCENRFGFEPEVTSKVSKIPGIRIYEVGISYYGRRYEDGKKIGWKDGLYAIYCIFKYNIFSRKYLK